MAKVSSLQSPTPRQASPFNLMQEAYRDDPWTLLVGTILFNMVHGSKARPVLAEFNKQWPTPEALIIDVKFSGLSIVTERMATMFQNLGLQSRRADRIWKMTVDFRSFHPDLRRDVDVQKHLHGIGKYGADSFNIFCRGYLVEDVTDKELRKYVDWALSTRSGGVVQADAGDPPETGGRPAETQQPGAS